MRIILPKRVNFIMAKVLLTLCLFSVDTYAQFTTYTYGAAGYQNPAAGVFRMTDDNGDFQVAAVWHNTPIDPRNAFDYYYNVYLGCQDAPGADGMGFVMAPSMGIGDGGANMGVYMNGGSNPPVMPNDIVLVEFDTWDNGGSYADIPNDHIVANKYNNSFCCPSLPPVDMGNMEDDLLHTVRIRYTPPPGEWDWDGGTLEVFFYDVGAPCPATPVFTYPVNIRSVTNSTSIYWGWTAATGGNKNEQWFSYNGTSTPPTYTTACTPLPIELLSFEGENNGDENLLKWTTLSETDNDFFTIESSTDGIHFTALGTVDGAGTKTTTTTYSLADHTPAKGINYYRLKQTDFDGHYSYSTVISIDNSLESPVRVYPTVFTGTFTIAIPTATQNTMINYEIVDALGKTYAQDSAPVEKLVAVGSTLSPGAYFVKVNVDGRVIVKKVIKQ